MRPTMGKRILYAALMVNNGGFYLSDEFPEHSGTPAPDA